MLDDLVYYYYYNSAKLRGEEKRREEKRREEKRREEKRREEKRRSTVLLFIDYIKICNKKNIKKSPKLMSAIKMPLPLRIRR
jgi:hypothetical protein